MVKIRVDGDTGVPPAIRPCKVVFVIGKNPVCPEDSGDRTAGLQTPVIAGAAANAQNQHKQQCRVGLKGNRITALPKADPTDYLADTRIRKSTLGAGTKANTMKQNITLSIDKELLKKESAAWKQE